MIPKSDMYRGTKVSPESSRGEVSKLLGKFGITEKRWTEQGLENTFLEFIIRQEGRPPIKVKINVPFIEKRSGGGDEPRAYRYFFYYLKALLSAKEAEISTIEEIFMAHIVQALPNGQEVTLGDQLNAMLESGNLPALEGFNIIPGDKKSRPELKAVES